MITNLRLVESLDSIGLAELIGSAELLTRIDRKYLIPPGEVDRVLVAVDPGARVLEIAGRRSFGYRSLYFDTVARDSYLSTAYRRRRRFKIRTRSYLDSDLHVLEIKTRGARGLTVKQRLPYAGDGLVLDHDDRTQVSELLHGLGIRVDGHALRPSLITQYDRTTLLLPGSGTRMTVDTGLVWSSAESPRSSISIDRAVIETKSPRACSSADRALWSLRHRPSTISKYGTGLAAMDPTLPSNRWHPVIRGHLTTTSNTTGEL